MNNLETIKNYNNESFEKIKHIDEYGNEFWLARELQKVLEYKEWRKFYNVINKSKKSCINSNNTICDHFVDVDKMVKTGDSERIIIDYKLTRYACYLIVQNSDPRKKVVAISQTYFAIQTRKQELSDKEYQELGEEDRRLYKRDKTKKANYLLNQAAKAAGVKNFDKFHNAGYKGLYNGETANDIAKRKGLRYREDILDNMSSEELAANEFRISQAESKLKRENIKTENDSNKAHFIVGKAIRDTIKKLGGTMPENLNTPDKSLKQIEKENKLNLKISNLLTNIICKIIILIYNIYIVYGGSI